MSMHWRSASGEARMFFRRKSVGERGYLQIVESRRIGSSVRQHVVATLGRAEDWLDTGKLDQLLQSGARLSETALVRALRDDDGLAVDSRRIGPPLIFERLWREKLPTLEVAMRYRELWKVEQIFRSSAPPRPCSKRRSITPATRPFAVTCSPPSWRWCCARNCRTSCRRRVCTWNGEISSVTSTASWKPPSTSTGAASCSATRRRAVRDPCSRPFASPCRPCSDAWTQKNPPRPPARPARKPRTRRLTPRKRSATPAAKNRIHK